MTTYVTCCCYFILVQKKEVTMCHFRLLINLGQNCEIGQFIYRCFHLVLKNVKNTSRCNHNTHRYGESSITPRQKNRRQAICDRVRKIVTEVHLMQKTSTTSSDGKSRFTAHPHPLRLPIIFNLFPPSYFKHSRQYILSLKQTKF